MNKARFEAFSDGVFAIVITLLAIELHPFYITSAEDFYTFIPKFSLFLLSFGTVAIYWVNHYHVTHTIEKIHSGLLWSNMLALLFVTLIPFVTGLLGENTASPAALAIYAGVQVCASGSFYALRRIIHGSNKEALVIRSFVGPICYSLALITAFIHPVVSYICILLPPIYYILPHSRDEASGA